MDGHGLVFYSRRMIVGSIKGIISLQISPREEGMACRYVDYLLDALRKKELFTWLQLSPKQFWHTLLFRDRYNFFGIKAHLPDSLSEQLRSHPGALTQVKPYNVWGGHLDFQMPLKIMLKTPRKECSSHSKIE